MVKGRCRQCTIMAITLILRYGEFNFSSNHIIYYYYYLLTLIRRILHSSMLE